MVAGRRLGSLLLLISMAAAAEPEPPPPESGGRRATPVTRPSLPEGLLHPERWRYIPDERMPPGDQIDRFLTTTLVLPIILAERSIGTGGGFVLSDFDFRHQRRREAIVLIATRSSEGQESYVLNWRRFTAHHETAGGVVLEERPSIRAGIAYERNLTRRYFGRGADSDAAQETSYTHETFRASGGGVLVFPEPGGSLSLSYLGGTIGSNLYRGHVESHPTLGELFPREAADADRVTMAFTELALSWDTRDSDSNPYRGRELTAVWTELPWQRNGTGSDDGDPGGLINLRGSWLIPLPGLFHDGGYPDEEDPPTDVLALAAGSESAFGSVPFWSLPSLGGRNRLRGHIADRFVDRTSWWGTVEWRVAVWPRGVHWGSFHLERIGIVPFYDVGSVAARPGLLPRAQVHHAVGIGLRLFFDRTILMRAEYGQSAEESNVVVSYGLPF